MRSPARSWLWSGSLLAAAASTWACNSRQPPALPSKPQPALSTASDREHISVTVYNQNLGLVRERRRVALGTGRVALTFRDVAEKLIPETVNVRSISAPTHAQILEQNYRYDLLSPETLLKKFVGKSVRIYRYNEQLGREESKTAQVLAVEKGVVLRVDGEITSASNLGRIAFPELPQNLVSRPTLEWLLESSSPKQDLEVSYLSQGLGWSADYVLALDADAGHGDLTGWVTLANESGVSFDNAELKLVAGDLNVVQRQLIAVGAVADEDQSAEVPPTPRQESLSEYHLYHVERPTTLRNKERKQVSLFGTRRVGARKKLVFTADPRLVVPLPPEARLSLPVVERPRSERAKVVLEVPNSAENGLGIPLPKGVLRAYTRDSSGTAQFVGADALDHTPRDETLRVTIGESFDVLLDRAAHKRAQVSRCTTETDWVLEIKNHKDQAQAVEIREQTGGGDYELVQTSQAPTRKTRDELSFELSIPARGTTRLEYRIRLRNC